MSRASLLICAIIACAPLSAGAQKPAHQPAADPIFGVDKVKHFFIAGFIESMAHAGMQAVGANRSAARSTAFAATAVASVGREIHDKRRKGLFSIRDLAWDAIGAGAALLVMNKTQR